jgi:hypothetical protein
VSLERGSLSLVSTSEELLDWKNSCSGLEIRDYGLGDASRWPLGTLCPQRLALTSPTCGGRSVSIVCSRTKTTELLLLLLLLCMTAVIVVPEHWSSSVHILLCPDTKLSV